MNTFVFLAGIDDVLCYWPHLSILLMAKAIHKTKAVELDYPVIKGSFPMSVLMTWEPHKHRNKSFDFLDKINFKKSSINEALVF